MCNRRFSKPKQTPSHCCAPTLVTFQLCNVTLWENRHFQRRKKHASECPLSTKIFLYDKLVLGHFISGSLWYFAAGINFKTLSNKCTFSVSSCAYMAIFYCISAVLLARSENWLVRYCKFVSCIKTLWKTRFLRVIGSLLKLFLLKL
jgi:hypothetical protein